MSLMLVSSSITLAYNDQQAWHEWLEVDGKRLPLYNYPDRSGQPRGSVLLILSAADEQTRSFKHLAALLPNHGWHTVAVVVDHEAMDDDSQFEKRISAALGKLPEQAGKPLVLLSSGQYALQSAQRFADGGFSKTTSAFVAFNRPAITDVEQLRRFHQQTMAVLDISTPSMHKPQLERLRTRLARELGQKHYRYRVLPPVAVSRVGASDALSKRILSWLNTSYSAG